MRSCLAFLLALAAHAVQPAWAQAQMPPQALDARAMAFIAAQPMAARPGFVNAAVNRYEFRPDASDGVVDEWLAPAQLRARGYGDCEDFAIAKLSALLRLGVPGDRLRLGYGWLSGGEGRRQAHLVLLYDDGKAELVLDNLSDTVQPLAERRDLQILFTFNREGLWDGMGAPQPHRVRELVRWAKVMPHL